jgi:hypothetical protein
MTDESRRPPQLQPLKEGQTLDPALGGTRKADRNEIERNLTEVQKAALARIRSRMRIFQAVQNFGEEYLVEHGRFDEVRMIKIHSVVFAEDEHIVGEALLHIPDIHDFVVNKPSMASGMEPSLSRPLPDRTIKVDEETAGNVYQAFESFESLARTRYRIFCAGEDIFRKRSSLEKHAAQLRLHIFFREVYGVQTREVSTVEELPADLRALVVHRIESREPGSLSVNHEDHSQFYEPYTLALIDQPMGHKYAALLNAHWNGFVGGEYYKYDVDFRKWRLAGFNHDFDLGEIALSINHA